MTGEASKSTAGVHLDSDGNRVVGGSVRADGSVRRIVRVRPGFTPQEDIKRYSVREAREKGDKGRGSLFGALNSELKGIALATDSSATATIATTTIANGRHRQVPKVEPTKKVSHDTTENGGITDWLSKLSLNSERSAAVFPPRSSTPESTSLPSTSASASTSAPPLPKKKYTPPQRRKKYTVADLDNR